MRTTLVVLNLVVAAASAGLLAYTVVARDHLVGLAEEYVVDKTVGFANPTVTELQRVLAVAQQQPGFAAVIPEAVRLGVAAEVAAYLRDPHRYIRELVATGAALEKPMHPLADHVLVWKEKVRAYFENALAGLIRDLRIFAGTNFVAGLLAAAIAYRASGRWRNHILGISGLLLLAVAFQSYLFVDGLTFFRILLDRRVGWGYPVLLAVAFAALYIDYGRHIPAAPPTSTACRNAE